MSEPSLPPTTEDLLSSASAGDSQLYQRAAYQLTHAGLNPRLDEDDQVIVLTLEQGDDIVIMFDEVPSATMRLFGQWAIDSSLPTDELTRLRAAMATTEECKLAKVFLSDNTVIAGVDHLIHPQTDIVELVTVCISAVLFAIHTWHEAMGMRLDEAADPTS